MRTTLTLEADVAAALKRIQAERGLSLKGAVNQALRRGLSVMDEPKATRAPYRTPSTSVGKCLIGGLDDVAEALATGEGEPFR
jgi:hypothetical protein